SDVVANFHDSNLTSQLRSLYYCVPPLKEGSDSMQRFLSEELSKFMKDVKHSSDESKKPSRYNFSALPDEIIMRILRNLDLKSLCRMSRVNKHFNNLAQDHLLYTSLNLKPYWHVIKKKALYYLAPRCKYLRRLDLSWCQGIDALADCKNLREVDFGWCGSTTGHGNSFRRLFSSCQHLEKVFLTSVRGLTERTLSLTAEICHAIFMNCPKLEMIDLSFCDNIADCSIQQWQQIYTHIAIKRVHCEW
ncbi:F-box/LRR-repeat protein 4, partial [Trachymyrmex cornetzi]